MVCFHRCKCDLVTNKWALVPVLCTLGCEEIQEDFIVLGYCEEFQFRQVVERLLNRIFQHQNPNLA
ncbi:hypothetical protein THRCLA_20640 [Thraustotheca clavata]|uniref:Uncharacterized protein n=1 Tax=Thraustotheca clavata TaxID=74557 RepID=A0A1W0A578_9STRA|nr:hypothetical protein THRCLA_20640 [Thraustotheca clavata]